MGLFSKLFKGAGSGHGKEQCQCQKRCACFSIRRWKTENSYRLIFGYTEDVARFNYGFVHGSKTKIGNLIVGWNESTQTIVVVPTVPDLSGCGDPTYYRRSELLKAYRNKYPTDAFIIYPDKRAISASMPTTGWMTNPCISTYPRRRNWRPSPISS